MKSTESALGRSISKAVEAFTATHAKKTIGVSKTRPPNEATPLGTPTKPKAPPIADPYTPWRERYSVYKAADYYPMVSDQELEEIATSIEQNGLIHPIQVWASPDAPSAKPVLLDGRNRLDAIDRLYKAGRRYEESPRIEQVHTESPEAYIRAANHLRRHLAKAERARINVKLQLDEAERAGRQLGDRATFLTLEFPESTLGRREWPMSRFNR